MGSLWLECFKLQVTEDLTGNAFNSEGMYHLLEGEILQLGWFQGCFFLATQNFIEVLDSFLLSAVPFPAC